MIATTIELDKFSLMRVERMMRAIPRGLPQAVSRGINKTGRKARSVTVKEITKVINQMRSKKSKLKQKDIRKRVLYKPATTRRLSAYMELIGRGLSLMLYGAEQTETGVTFVSAGGSAEEIPHAFIPELPSGHMGVFRRTQSTRLPIVEIYGDSVADIWEEAPSFARSVLEDINRNLYTNIETQANLIIEKFKKRKSA